MSIRQVAIIGCGPSGLFLAEHLLNSLKEKVQIDFYDKSILPFGLLRYGVSPFHSGIKEKYGQWFRNILEDGRVQFYGNVNIGCDVNIQSLIDNYHTVVLSYGASKDYEMGIPGESAGGIFPANEFINWYNGNPDFREMTPTFEKYLSKATSATVIGQGNVAMDIAHVLISTEKSQKKARMSLDVIEALKKSNVHDVYVVGRRGPLQTAFTTGELFDLSLVKETLIEVPLKKFTNDEKQMIRKNPQLKRKVKLLEDIQRKYEKSLDKKLNQVLPTIHFRFLLSPKNVISDQNSDIKTLILKENNLVYQNPKNAKSAKAKATDREQPLDTQLLFRSIGYRSVDIFNGKAGIPLNEKKNIIENSCGKVKGNDQVYVCGWLKRGPKGTVPSNRLCSEDTAQQILKDTDDSLISKPKFGSQKVLSLIMQNNYKIIRKRDWKRIEDEQQSRPYTINSKDEMLSICGMK
eukprot:Anaeramoba_ignava/a1964_78.p1 GENE.a1964_78~~a1964_78.p1  ORF type:complete len:463 (-),score=90.42 a1964_78:79-1467(-)